MRKQHEQVLSLSIATKIFQIHKSCLRILHNLTVDKMIRKDFFSCSVIAVYSKNQTFGWMTELSKIPPKRFISFTFYISVFQE